MLTVLNENIISGNINLCDFLLFQLFSKHSEMRFYFIANINFIHILQRILNILIIIWV